MKTSEILKFIVTTFIYTGLIYVFLAFSMWDLRWYESVGEWWILGRIALFLYVVVVPLAMYLGLHKK